MKDASQKYSSRAAQLYRDKLSQSVAKSLKTYGNVLEIPNCNKIAKDDSAEVTSKDFFEEASTLLPTTTVKNDDIFLTEASSKTKLSSEGPNVNLNFDSTKLNEYKSTVIGKKSNNNKKVLFYNFVLT